LRSSSRLMSSYMPASAERSKNKREQTPFQVRPPRDITSSTATAQLGPPHEPDGLRGIKYQCGQESGVVWSCPRLSPKLKTAAKYSRGPVVR
jgi:hypothetical protein